MSERNPMAKYEHTFRIQWSPAMTTLLPGADISMKMTLRGNSSFISLVVFRISWLTEVYISRVAIDCSRDVSAAGRHLKAEDTNGEEKRNLLFARVTIKT